MYYITIIYAVRDKSSSLNEPRKAKNLDTGELIHCLFGIHAILQFCFDHITVNNNNQ